MMAVVILAFAVASLSTMLYASAKNAQADEYKNIAVDVAHNDMEVLLASKLNDLSSSSGSDTDEAIASTSLSTTTGPVTHTGVISYISRSAGQTVRDVAVIKTTATTSDGQSVTFKRLITRAGASQ